MLRKILDYITKDPKGQKQWGIGFAIVGTIVSITIAKVTWNPQGSLYKNIGPSLSVPVGFLCVYLLGMRKNVGNILGITANLNEIAVHTTFGNFGYLISSIYFGISHLFGYIDWNQNKDEDGNTQIRDLDNKNGVKTLFFFLALGTVFVIVNHYFKWFTVTDNPLVFWGNIVVMYLLIVAQGTMILRYRYSWWIWFASNLISIPLQISTGNYVFAVMFFFYEINCILALYAQYTGVDTQKEKLQEA